MYLRSVKSLLAMASFLPASIILAQSPLPKIVTVSFTQAVMQTNEAQHDFAALQSKFAPRQARIEGLNKEVQELQKVLNDSGEKLGTSERNARIQSLADKEKQLQRAEEDYRNDSQSEGQTAFQLVAQKVFEFLQDYAKQRGLSAVIDRGNDSAPVVWYAAQDIDITNALISAYNAQSGIAAPGATMQTHPSLSQPQNVPTPAKSHP